MKLCSSSRLHFQNLSFGLHTDEDPSLTPPIEQELIPGQHQYTNPMEGREGSGVSDAPMCN
jgi:hypothetical protein